MQTQYLCVGTLIALVMIAGAEETIDGCTTTGTNGRCGGVSGFAVTECNNLKLQAAFTITLSSCAEKTQETLDDCAAKFEAKTPMPDACKVSSLAFSVKQETGTTSQWQTLRSAYTSTGVACNAAIGTVGI